jgi:DNA-binding MarR family transcriptional regulator
MWLVIRSRAVDDPDESRGPANALLLVQDRVVERQAVIALPTGQLSIYVTVVFECFASGDGLLPIVGGDETRHLEGVVRHSHAKGAAAARAIALYDHGMRQPARDAAGEPVLDPVLDFLRLLWSIEHGLQSTSKRMETTIGITAPQRLVLRVVSRYPDISAGDLAHVVRLHPSTITGILQRLVAKGLLVRDADSDDTRRVRLRVRNRARSLARRSPGTVEAAVQRVLARVPAAHVTHARSILAAIAEALEPPSSALRRRRTLRRVRQDRSV